MVVVVDVVTSAGEILVLGHSFTPAAAAHCTTTPQFSPAAAHQSNISLANSEHVAAGMEISEQHTLTRDYFRASALNIFDMF